MTSPVGYTSPSKILETAIEYTSKEKITKEIQKTEGLKNFLEADFASLIQNYLTTIRMTTQYSTISKAGVQNAIDMSYLKLLDFVCEYPEFEKQLPERFQV